MFEYLSCSRHYSRPWKDCRGPRSRVLALMEFTFWWGTHINKKETTTSVR